MITRSLDENAWELKDCLMIHGKVGLDFSYICERTEELFVVDRARQIDGSTEFTS